MEYKVVHMRIRKEEIVWGISEFERKVKDFLKDGYELAGALQIIDHNYTYDFFQAVVKK